jgi:hypothetical protein
MAQGIQGEFFFDKLGHEGFFHDMSPLYYDTHPIRGPVGVAQHI